MKGGCRFFSPITEAIAELNNIFMDLYSLDLLSYSFLTSPTILPTSIWPINTWEPISDRVNYL